MSLFTISLSTWISIASVAYSFYNQSKIRRAQKKAQAEQEAKADKARGFQIVVDNQAGDLPVVYGRNKLGGIRVFSSVSTNFNFANPAPGGLYFDGMKPADENYRLILKSNWDGSVITNSSEAEFLANPGFVSTLADNGTFHKPSKSWVNDNVRDTAPTVTFLYVPYNGDLIPEVPPNVVVEALSAEIPSTPSMNSSQTGEKNEFLVTQQAVAWAGLSNIHAVEVDERPHNHPDYGFGMRLHVYKDGGQADPMITANAPHRSGSRFTNTASVHGAFRLNREEPQFNGLPDVKLYVDGNRVRTISGGAFGEYIESNNPALILADYMSNSQYGKSIPDNELDLHSFEQAARVCDYIIVDNATKAGQLWLNKSGDRKVRMYECNISLSTSKPVRENIQSILGTMGLATLVWSDGKYKLNLPYARYWVPLYTFPSGDTVQRGSNFYEAIADVNSTVEPENDSINWRLKVYPLVNDDSLALENEVLITYPSSDTKLNYVTVRFTDEDKDFADNTVSWPEKTSSLYAQFLAEDNNISLETEDSAYGVTTIWHARQAAEQHVRASRGTVVYTFKAHADMFKLEPGDVCQLESEVYGISKVTLKVDDVETEKGGLVKITGSTFDAALLAANVDDLSPSEPYDSSKTYTLGQARELRLMASSVEALSERTLLWARADDNRVVSYTVKYTTVSIDNLSSTTAWTTMGNTRDTRFVLPAMEGNVTFAVVATSATGRQAPFKDIFNGSAWPVISADMSAAFVEASLGGISLMLSNPSVVVTCDSAGNVTSYANTATELRVYRGAVQQSNYTVTASSLGITAGTLTTTDGVTQVTAASNMLVDNALVIFQVVLDDKTLSVSQVLTKVKAGEPAPVATQSNPLVTFQTDAAGTVTSYNGTSNTIGVSVNGVALTANSTGTAAGTFKVAASGSGITPGAVAEGVISNASAMTSDAAEILVTVTGVTPRGSQFTINMKQLLRKVKQGFTGDRSTTVNIYQWSTVTPAIPTQVSSLNWSTKVLSSVPSGWSASIPTNPGTPGLKLWQVSATVSAAFDAVNSSVTWTTRADITQNGSAGLSATTVSVYKWALTLPAAPTGTGVYNWVSGLSAAPTGWSKSTSGGAAGQTLYAANVFITDAATTATTSVPWELASIQALSYNGGDGLSARVAYGVSTDGSQKSGGITTEGLNSLPWDGAWGMVWSSSPQNPSSGQYVFRVDGVANPGNNTITWDTPYISTFKVGNLSALSANMGVLTAGKIQNGDATVVMDLDATGSNPMLRIKSPSLPVDCFRIGRDGAMTLGNQVAIVDKTSGLPLNVVAKHTYTGAIADARMPSTSRAVALGGPSWHSQLAVGQRIPSGQRILTFSGLIRNYYYYTLWVKEYYAGVWHSYTVNGTNQFSPYDTSSITFDWYPEYVTSGEDEKYRNQYFQLDIIKNIPDDYLVYMCLTSAGTYWQSNISAFQTKNDGHVGFHDHRISVQSINL